MDIAIKERTDFNILIEIEQNILNCPALNNQFFTPILFLLNCQNIKQIAGRFVFMIIHQYRD